MIRKMRASDIEQVMQIWLDGNMEAHSFVPEAYWKSNISLVREQLLQSEVYVYEESGTVLGFAGMQEDYLAGIFVEKSVRSMGIGKKLLDYIKKIRTAFSLNVYQENHRAAAFYQREGLTKSSEGIEESTGNMEYTMMWRKEQTIAP